ncbi:hypothetical protein [Mesobacillus harenae]|uniref:hypothetical protein n=1 Tax=Mesobacillus harenae TaxID=2213203 RepID=UPI00158025F5|nr:hypothetical protein [Mesobacillus harenae]
MTQMACNKCKKVLNPEEIIKTDEFKEYGSNVKQYCTNCFIREVKHGFGNYNIGNCEVCNSPLILQYDYEETISLAQDDYTVNYVCKKVKEAMDNGNDDEVERLDQEDHDWLILYTIQPDPEEPDDFA